MKYLIKLDQNSRSYFLAADKYGSGWYGATNNAHEFDSPALACAFWHGLASGLLDRLGTAGVHIEGPRGGRYSIETGKIE